MLLDEKLDELHEGRMGNPQSLAAHRDVVERLNRAAIVTTAQRLVVAGTL